MRSGPEFVTAHEEQTDGTRLGLWLRCVTVVLQLGCAFDLVWDKRQIIQSVRYRAARLRAGIDCNAQQEQVMSHSSQLTSALLNDIGSIGHL